VSHPNQTHFPNFSAFSTGEKEEEAEKDKEKIEELEQTLFELRGEIGAGRHVPPGVRVLSLCENPAQNWADLRQAALDRLKAENSATPTPLRSQHQQQSTPPRGRGAASATRELGGSL
jgi:mitotic spindle assembly checkpoint protein MAD1